MNDQPQLPQQLSESNQTQTRIVLLKARVSRVALALAVILFVSGFFMLCDCPGIYALAAALAGVSAWASNGKLRFWAVVTAILSVGVTIIMIIR